MSVPCDPDFSQVSLLVDFDGTDGQTTVTDLSNNAIPLDTSGVSGAINTANPRFGTGAYDFTNYYGAGAITSPAIAVRGPLDFEGGDWTVELWVAPHQDGGTRGGYILGAWAPPAGWFLRFSGVDEGFALTWYNAAGVTATTATIGPALTAGVWHHIAVVRYGDVFNIYVDGVGSGGFTLAGAIPPADVLTIGENTNTGGFSWDGQIDELRITKGLARYTANFTPPTQAFPTIACGTTVPNVVGELQADAATALTNAGFVVGTVTVTPDTIDPATTVLTQNPAAGSTEAPGSAVDLTVASGPPPLTIPNVIGDTVSAAQSALTALGYVVGVLSYSYDSTPAGITLTQSPAAGTVEPSGTVVYLGISQGPRPVYVPDLTNLTELAANAALLAVGLLSGVVGFGVNAFTAAGAVVTQNPPPFTQVAAGSLVNYLISTGEPDAPLITATGFDVDSTVISQYANSPTLLALIHNMAAYLDQSQNFANFYNFVWNVDTAQGFGLDIWGKIVGISRLLHIPNSALPFGFQDHALIQDVEPFNQAPFNSYDAEVTQTYLLTDAAFRVLILCKALSNISATTAPAINQLLRNLFPGRGACYVLDLGAMTMQFTFAFANPLSETEYAILTQSGALPHPAGVGVTIAQIAP